ncbi:uncharacterized protein LOC6504997 [Drosophila ananassae]|uniref:uncharacterized protein LOC6504997 n=1 Tax=Drosophila ananassae TaxID=7217 RepID=UPI001CFFDD00|nr:uncharacterized protein LOC6504997 [Drosophila ananassae]
MPGIGQATFVSEYPTMKVLNLCLLIVAFASCLLATTNANAIGYDTDMDGMDLETYIDDMDMEFMDIEAHGFIHGCWSVLKAGYRGVNGTKCIIEETANVVLDCTNYLDEIAKCTTAMPKDILNIVNKIKGIISTGASLTDLQTLCASDETTNTFWLKKWFNCGAKMLYKTMSMVRGMNVVIKLSSKLPKDTSNCYVSATQDVVDSCNAYVPNINQCIASIKGKN